MAQLLKDKAHNQIKFHILLSVPKNNLIEMLLILILSYCYNKWDLYLLMAA